MPVNIFPAKQMAFKSPLKGGFYIFFEYKKKPDYNGFSGATPTC